MSCGGPKRLNALEAILVAITSFHLWEGLSWQISQSRCQLDFLAADKCVVVPPLLFISPEPGKSRFAFGLEFANDLEVPFVVGWEEERLREIDACCASLGAQARDNIGDVDGDHQAGVTKVRHDLLRSSARHHN